MWLNIGTSGKITILFPNAFIQENFIRANQVYSIPGQEYPFLYKLTGPIGTEKIKVIATIKPVNLIEKDFSKLGDLAFYGATGQRAIRDIEIVAKKSIPHINNSFGLSIKISVKIKFPIDADGICLHTFLIMPLNVLTVVDTFAPNTDFLKTMHVPSPGGCEPPETGFP